MTGVRMKPLLCLLVISLQIGTIDTFTTSTTGSTTTSTTGTTTTGTTGTTTTGTTGTTTTGTTTTGSTDTTTTGTTGTTTTGTTGTTGTTTTGTTTTGTTDTTTTGTTTTGTTGTTTTGTTGTTTTGTTTTGTTGTTTTGTTTTGTTGTTTTGTTTTGTTGTTTTGTTTTGTTGTTTTGTTTTGTSGTTTTGTTTTGTTGTTTTGTTTTGTTGTTTTGTTTTGTSGTTTTGTTGTTTTGTTTTGTTGTTTTGTTTTGTSGTTTTGTTGTTTTGTTTTGTTGTATTDTTTTGSTGSTTSGTTGTATTGSTATGTTGATTAGSTVISCAHSPCENGATCSDTASDAFCLCPDGFGGIFCEQAVINAATTSNTYASSVHEPWGPGNAVNGNNAQNAASNTCLVTLNQQNPFILIDLRALHTITHIKIYNRLDCCTTQMLNLVLFTGTTSSSLTEQITLPGPIGSTAVFNLDPYITARYVKLEINGQTVLHLCEVEIYTINVPRCNGQQYDPSSQLCCGNTIFDITNNHTACCGDATYDTVHQSCSNGYVLSNFLPSMLLCDGFLHDMLYDNICCCGTEIFDATSSVCCNGIVRPRLPNELFCCQCKDPRLDLALVTDMSEGLSDTEIQQLMTLIENIIQALQTDIDNGNIRVAFVAFTDEVFVEFQLTDYQNATDMIIHLNNVPPRSGGTRTDKALAALYMDVFNATNDARSDVQNVALLFTDGNSNDVLQTITEADSAKTAGIRIIVSAIGTDTGNFEIESVASEPSSENVYHVDYFANLANIEQNLIQIFFEECENFPASPMCGGVQYDPATQVCCGVILVNITDPLERECCGTTLYNSTTQACCAYNIVYDPNTEICCGGTTYDNTYQCCNSIHPYLPSSNICCIDTLQPLHGAGSTACCGRVSYDTTCHTCANGVVTLNFNEQTELCCDGNIQQKLYAYSCCCGQYVFDAETHTCCNGQVINRTSSDDDHCCHCINKMVDIALVFDLSESVHDQAAKHASMMSFAKSIIDDSDIPNMRFSVVTFTHEVFVEFLLYEYSTAQEMKNKIDLIPVRSGGTNTGSAIQSLYTMVFNGAYGDRANAPNVAVIVTDGKSNDNAQTIQEAAIAKNMGIHILTVGVGMTDMSELHQIASPPSAENVFTSSDFSHLFTIIDVIESKFKEECTDKPAMLFCGINAYDPKSHVCCNGHLVTITNVNETHCCGNFPWTTLYDINNAVCCNGVVIPITIPGHHSCCGSYSLYNPAIQQCCGGNAIGLTEACCGNHTSYNPDDRICCNGIVNPLQGLDTTECCGTISYNSQCNQCVNNVVVLGYDEATQMCCNGNIQNKTHHLSCCCGSSVINAVTFTCCGGIPIPRPPSDTSNCCHCINRMVDVAIVVDASESVYDVPGSIDLLLSFVKDIIMDSAVDSGDVRFAVSLYNHAVYNYFYLNTHTTVAQMILDIDSTPLPISGGTSTGLALEHLHSQVFLYTMGDRPDAPNLAIVITDGKSSDNVATVTHASTLKQQGVHVIAIGIGSYTDATELNQIASDPSFENVFNVVDFNGLLSIQALIEQKFVEECTETPVMPLCGTVPYNPTVNVCCQGHLQLIVNASATHCCGSYSWTALYDPNSAVCCNNVVIPITEQGQDSCCGTSYLYNSLTQKCCGGYPVSITQECCGNNHPFDPLTEICCNGTVNPLHGFGTTECCATVSFDNKCNRCINGVVVLGYDEATEMCCEGVIHYKQYAYSCCCGTNVINALNFTCCGDIPITRSPLDSSLCCHCINRMVDVAVIADISESINDTPNNIFYLLDFIKHMINSSAIDSGDVRFALSLFSHEVYNYFYFNTHTTIAQMIADINATPLPNNGGTHTGLALEHLHTQVFQASMGDRNAAPNIAVVVTDGKSYDNAYTVQQANILKSQGIHIIVIGIGNNIDTVELHQVASDPTFENVFNVYDFSELFTIQNVIEEKFIEECKKFPDTPYCGYQQYNPFEYTCCNGHLVAITDPAKRQCCGYGAYATLYDSVNQVCCNGQVLNITFQGANICCGSSLYNPNTERCCGETVVSNTMECCGNTSAFNSAIQICCNGLVQPIHGLGTTACCGTQSFDTRCDQCYNGVIGLRYDERTELCCDGVISSKLYHYSCCCGNTVIDASVSTCCNGVPEIRPAWDNSLCCHCINRKIDLAIAADMSESVNDATNKVQVVLDFIIDIINSSDIDTGNVHVAVSIFTHDVQNLFFLNSYINRQDMINDILATQIYFGGTNTGGALQNLYTQVFTPMRGDRPDAPNIAIVLTDGKSNDETDTMIQAAEVKARGIHVIGVGIGLTDISELNVIASPPSRQNVFNVDDFIQLNSIVGDIEAMFVENCTDTPDMLYCGAIQYDPHAHVCCGGTLFMVTDQNARTCCGSHLYDVSTAVCCDGNVVQIQNAGQTSCCGSLSLYNPLIEKCCAGHVISITMDCCGAGLFYDNTTQLCCEGTVQPMHGIGTTSCCGAQSYDTRCNKCSPGGVVLGYDEERELCCNGVIQQRLYTFSCCCGQTVIDATLNTCCDGTVIQRPPWDDSLCCHCTSRKIDIAFAVDFSESVHDYSSDVSYLVNFITNLINMTDVDTTNVRIALSVYTHDVLNYFFLNTYQTRAEMINYIQSASFPQGGTNTGAALENLYSTVFKTIKGDRLDAPDIAVVITDGKSNNNTDTLIQSTILKQSGVHVIGIGIGMTDTLELNQIASEPSSENVFNVADFSELFSIEDIVKDKFTEDCTDTPEMLLCGNIRYDPRAYVCCDEELVILTNPKARTCCGVSGVYDETYAVCCNGNIIQITAAGRTSCCGDTMLYNPSTEACCDGIVQSISSECCSNEKVDVALVADSSESIMMSEYHFEMLWSLTENIIMQADVESGNVRIALTVYTHKVFNEFLLNKYKTRNNMIEHIIGLPIRSGSTNTGRALENLYTNVFTSSSGDRKTVQNVAIIITDGESTNVTYTTAQANKAKLAGIHIIAVGIDVMETSELYEMASTPKEENVFVVNDHNDLSDTVSAIELKFFSQCKQGHYCGGVAYDVREYVCCNGNVQYRYNGDSTRCCRGQSYDSKHSVCCRGNILPAIAGESTKCCGKKTFDPSKNLCCDNKIKERSSSTTKCCGRSTFESTCFKCNSKDIIVPRFNEKTSVCCSGNIMDRKYGGNSCCCGNKQIDLSKTACCDGRPRKVPQSSPCACCGERLFNVKSQICCKTKRQRLIYGYDSQCCDDEVYNMKTHICCEGTLHEKRSQGDTSCCGENSYNPRKEKCCDGIVQIIPDSVDVNKFLCCGKVIFDSSKQICCENALYSRNNANQSCCGQMHESETGCCSGLPYDPSIYICCSGKILSRATSSADSCCGDSRTYDSQNEICCNDVVQFKVSGGTTQCCGTNSYDPSLHICCDERTKYRKYGELTACCGTRVYNPVKENCCNGLLVKFAPEKDGEWNSESETHQEDDMNDPDSAIQIEKKKNKETEKTQSTSKVIRKNKIAKLKAILKAYEKRYTKVTDKTILKKIEMKKKKLVLKLKKILNNYEIDSKTKDIKKVIPTKRNRLRILKRKRNRLRKKLLKSNDKDETKRLKKKLKSIEKKIARFSDTDSMPGNKNIDRTGINKERLKRLLQEFKVKLKILSQAKDPRVKKKIRHEIQSLESNIRKLKQKLELVEDQPRLEKKENRNRNKIKRLIKKLKKLKQQIPKAKTKKEMETLLKKTNLIKDKINKVRKQQNEDNKEKDGKPINWRLDNLHRKLAIIKKRLSKAENKSDKKRLLEKKKIVQKRINRLTGLKNKNNENEKRTIGKLENNEDDNKKNIKLLKSKLKDTLAKIEETNNKEVKSNLKDKADKLSEKIRRLKVLSTINNDVHNDKLDLLKSKLKEVKKQISKTKNEKETKSLQEKAEQIKEKIDKIRERQHEDDENKDGKTKKERLNILRRKLAVIKKRLPETKNKAGAKKLLKKQKIIRKRINRLTGNNDKDDQTKNKKTDKIENNDESNKEKIKTLKAKLKNTIEKIGETNDRKTKNKLKEKADILLTKIRQLKEKLPDKNSDNVDEDKLGRLKSKLKEIKKEISATRNEKEKKSLQDKVKKIQEKIDKIRERQNEDDENKDGKTKKERLDILRRKLSVIKKRLPETKNKADAKKLLEKQEIIRKRINRLTGNNDKDDQTKIKKTDKTENNDESNKEKIKTLKAKLKNTIEKIGKPNDRKTKNELKEKADNLLTKIRRLKEQLPDKNSDNVDEDNLDRLKSKLKEVKKQISTTKNEKETKSLQEKAEQIKEKIDKIRERQDKDGENKDGKTKKERLNILRRKLAVIKKRLPETKNKADAKKLLKKQETIRKRINRLTGKNDKDDQTKNKKTDKNENNDESNKEKIKTLKAKLKNTIEKMGETNDKKTKNELKEKADKLLTKIRRLKEQLPDKNSDNVDEDKLDRLKSKLKEIKKEISATKNEKEKKSLQDKAGKIEEKMDKIRERQNEDDENKDGKTKKERLDILRRKLAVINKRLPETKNKADAKKLLEKQEMLRKRINRLTGNSDKDDQTKNKKTDKTENNDGGNKQDIKTLKAKLKNTIEKIGETNDRKTKNELKEKADNLLKKIRQLKEQNPDYNNDDINEDKIDKLKSKLKEVKKQISASRNEQEKKSLQDKAEKIEEKIDKIRERQNEDDENKDGKTKKERLDILRRKLSVIKKRLPETKNKADAKKLLDKQEIIRKRINRLTGNNDKDDQTKNKKTDKTENNDESNKEKIKTLKAKLKNTIEKIGETNDRKTKNELKDRADKLTQKIRHLKGLSSLESEDENNEKEDNKNKKTNDSDKKPSESKSLKEEEEDPDDFDDARIISLLRQLKEIKKQISDTKDERENKYLQQAADGLKNIIQTLRKQLKQDDRNGDRNRDKPRDDTMNDGTNNKERYNKEKSNEIIDANGRKGSGKETENKDNFKQIKSKYRKIQNRISNTKDKLEMQNRKKSILENKLEKISDRNNKRPGEMDIKTRLQFLNNYLEKLEIKISQSSDKEKRKNLKEDRLLLNERIAFLRKELDESDGVSDTETINDRLSKLKAKLEIVVRRLKTEDDPKTKNTLKKKLKVLRRRIDGLTKELSY